MSSIEKAYVVFLFNVVNIAGKYESKKSLAHKKQATISRDFFNDLKKWSCLSWVSSPINNPAYSCHQNPDF